jgi:hypothetical protein
VREALTRPPGKPRRTDRLERSWPAERGSYRVEVLTLHTSAGAERIFLKDFGSCKHAKEHMEERRTRELRVHRDVLRTAGLGTPAYRGSVWDPCHQRFWLLLEYVEGRRLSDLDFEHWVDAARWIGRLQRHFRDEARTDGTFLEEHGPAFFWSVAEAALQAVAAVAPDLLPRLESALRRYDEPVGAMASAPFTLVHGVFRPYNVLVRAAGDGAAAICVTDWEECARGGPLYDLAYLSDGFEPAQLHRLIDAYEEELGEGGSSPRERDESLFLLRCLYAHRNLKTLAKAASRDGFTDRGIAGLVTRTDELLRGLQ